MGLYPIDCPACKKPHMWFSGTMDQRCEACKKPKEWWINETWCGPLLSNGQPPPHKHPYGWNFLQVAWDHITDVIRNEWTNVIEKSAYDFQCKQVEDMAKQFNESCQYYQNLVKDLNNQLSIEKAEVSRLLAFNKRARTRKKKD